MSMRFSNFRPAGGRCLFGLVALAAVPGAAQAADLPEVCGDCQVHIGAGGTYHFWSSTRGVVVPVTLTFDADRYEVGVFRMTKSQSFYNDRFHFEQQTAHPYWGISASRRWALLHGEAWQVFFGFGASYKTESDDLSVTHWNFASQLGMRISLNQHGSSLELTARHWSNAGIRLPNRGQDFYTLTYAFSPGR
jgi:hypothetical protein